MTELPARRLMLVHAHPDDESISTGATMARYAAEGALVTLVTCTLGEEGEVIPSEYAHLAADRDDTLGQHRVGELAAAMRELGVQDHRFLGGLGRYRDSGMLGLERNQRPEAFHQADVDEAAAHLVETIREVRPQVLVTYGPDGGYGHPDHVRAHQVAMRAADLAADSSWRPDLGAVHTVAKIYWICVPRSLLEEAFVPLRTGGGPFAKVASLDDVPGVVDDEWVTATIDASRYGERKVAAMRAHATQLEVRGRYFALSNGLAQPLSAVESYHLARGKRGTAGLEDDLFAGLRG